MVLTRPELLDARPWGARLPAHTSIALDPLTSEETRELATGLVVDTGDAGVDVERLVSLSDGNPLFVEELTAAIADGASGSGLPVTVTAAIAARLDVLPPSLRTVLFSAAVVGRTFWRDVVAAIADERTVDDALDELERRDLVRREHDSRLEGDVEYRFRHALIQDVAYATLTRVERAARHADVARYIEQRVGTDAGPVAWILAHHWRSAGDPARAVPHLLAAAEVAERGWATREVVELYSLAAELADDDETRARIRLRRGMALKALDADHEAAAELAAVLGSFGGPSGSTGCSMRGGPRSGRSATRRRFGTGSRLWRLPRSSTTLTAASPRSRSSATPSPSAVRKVTWTGHSRSGTRRSRRGRRASADTSMQITSTSRRT